MAETQIHGSRYRLGQVLGQGGMGIVYRGDDLRLRRPVAIKKLRADLLVAGQGLARLRREVELQARIPDKRHVVEVFDLVEENGDVYLVMEYVAGSETLRSVIRPAGVGQEGGLGADEAKAVCQDTVAGLAAVHGAGVVHGDVKADNFLRGAGGQWKLADFGLSRLQTEASLRTLTMGTARNVAPEVFEGRLLPASDVYSLGMVLYELYVGATAFAAEFAGQVGADRADLAWMRWHCDGQKRTRPAREVNPGVPEEMSVLLSRMLEKDPARRAALSDVVAAVAGAPAAGAAAVEAAVVAGEPAPLRAPRRRGERERQAATPPEQPIVAAVGGNATAANGDATAPLARPPARPRRGAVVGVAVLAVAGALGVWSWQQGWWADAAGAPGASVGAAPVAVPEPPVLLGDVERLVTESHVVLHGTLPTRDVQAVEVGGRPGGLGIHEADATWMASVELQAGRNEIPVVAIGSGGRSKPLLVVATLDLEPPRFEPSPDQPAAPRRTSKFQVRGKVGDDVGVVRVTVNGVDAQLSPAGGREAEFAHEIDLVEGPNFLVLTAWDRAGRSAVDHRVVVVDKTPPVVRVQQPVDGAWIAGEQVTVGGVVVDLNGVAGVTVSGVAASVKDGVFECIATAERIVIVATDHAGNASEPLVCQVRFDRSVPEVKFAEPFVATKAPLEVKGDVRDDGELVSLLVDGQQVHPSSRAQDGWRAFAWPVTEPGRRSVSVLATDAAGRTTRRTVSVLLDVDPPLLRLVALPEQLQTDSVVVRGEVVDDCGLASLTIAGKEIVAAAGMRAHPIEQNVLLGKEGVNTIEVVARDVAGHESRRSLSTRRSVLNGVSAWAEVLAQEPDPAVVTDEQARKRILEARWPWRVKDKKSGAVMVLIPAGEFDMGSPTNESERGDDETRHRRTIRQPFYLGEWEVTQRQWCQVMGKERNPSGVKGDGMPVTNVSWEECQDFVQRAGLRLPSEAEWEYACRAGTRTRYSFGDTLTGAQATFGGSKAVPSGSGKANAWGLSEMHGNVWEWCQDAYGVYPSSGNEEPNESGVSRVLRGGSFYGGPRDCRSARRHPDDPTYRFVNVGFRVARTAAP